MSWLLIAVFAYLLFALANIGDKLVVSQYKTAPIVYAFYVGILGISAVALWPFGVIWPGFWQLIWAGLAGAAFIMAAYCMYQALSHGETSTAITLMGGSAPIFTFLLSYLFISERLYATQLWSFAILVLAIMVIAWQPGSKDKKIGAKQLTWAILAGFIFAVSYVASKYVYLSQPFISGFVWIRLGGVLTAVLILSWQQNRQAIKLDWQQPKKQKGYLILVIQILGGLGVVGQNYAFSLASATLVNALQAIQYASIFILATLLGKRVPALQETTTTKQFGQKAFAIILIAIGLYILALN